MLSWSRGAQRLFGYTSEEACGRVLGELLLPPAEQAAAQRLLDEVRATGSVLLEAERRHQDGSTVYVEESMRQVSAAGHPPFIAVTEKDASRRRGLRAQQLPELKVFSMMQSAPDAMVVVGPDGAIVFVNAQAEALFGYARGALLGQSVEVLVPGRLRSGHPGHRASYQATPQYRPMNARGELFGVRRDGTELSLEVSLSPLLTETGALVACALRDVTERNRQQRSLVEGSRMKSEFLANMSHELRTPLNAIIGFAELMFKGKAGPTSPEHHEYLGDIVNSGKHLLQLINDVLDLAKVESGKMEFRVQPVDLAQLVREVRDIVRGLAASKHLRLGVEVDPEVASVEVDPGRVKQVLYNYLSNAIKFTPDGGAVTVRARPEGAEQFRLEVEDTGIGIRSEDLGRLFVEFQQLDTPAARAHQGTGLGLALTRTIVERHGGRVEVRSTVGEGSVFSAVLPRRPSGGAHGG